MFVSEDELAVSVPVQRIPAPVKFFDLFLNDELLSSWGRRLFWFFGLTLGLIETVASRFSMMVDGISYLDLGHAYLIHDWNTAINGYWSPLYGVLLAVAIRLCNASLYWESTIVHAVNFLIFVASMAAFEFFLAELCRSQRSPVQGNASVQPVPVWAMRAFGYSLFLYSGLVWISIWTVTPDQCVAVVMYLVAGLLLRMQRVSAGWTSYLLLGILLGVGYLTKAALFPLGIVSLAATLFLGSDYRFRRRLPRTIVTALAFAIVASPLVIVLSRAKGRFTFGDSGRINYAEFVDEAFPFGQWQRDENLGNLKHPVRKVLGNPSVFEFATPIGGTYPPWYDASYWLDGLHTHFDLRGELRALGQGARAYLKCALEQSGVIIGFLMLLALGRAHDGYWRRFKSTWPGWIGAAAGLCLFSLVLVETRYVGGFLTIFGLSCFGAIRLRPSVGTRRFTLGLSLAVAAVGLLSVAVVARRNLYSSLFRPRSVQWEAAQAIQGNGIEPGDSVATIIDHREGDYWAHLAKLKIIEEIPLDEMPKLTSLDAESRAQLIRVLQKPGAKAIITTPAPPEGTGFRWDRLGNTEYYISSLAHDDRN
jgi:hypothetical protein